ncbi:hypothetical protein OXIME_000189 [Oxyplasma meridianum]|uniref:Uncharacterized protein n=1 Tax=Oxyplasma meridianum TaxID=3073602 RepID=A0AAX4NEB2_9ARCH
MALLIIPLREINNRLDFMNFLDFPSSVPDARTVWFFKDVLYKTGKDKIIWNSIWKQFKEKGISVKKGTIQDATCMETDPWHGDRKKDEKTLDEMISPYTSEKKKEMNPQRRS